MIRMRGGTHEIGTIEVGRAVESHGGREPQIPNWGSSKGDAQVFRDLRLVGGRMATDGATGCPDRLSYGPIGLGALEILRFCNDGGCADSC
jgi:hypothetical protein